MSSTRRTVSWAVLALLGTVMLLFSLISAAVAYRGPHRDRIGSLVLPELAAGRAEVATALQARRGTAAAFGAGYAVLFLSIVLGPYRRGETWSWWALLGGTLATALVILARIPLLHTRLGAGSGALMLAIVLVALLLDAGRLGAKPA